MKRSVISICLMMLVAGCDRQRDLYATVESSIYVEGDWMPSLGRDDMTMDATAVAYTDQGESLYAKEYFYNPDNTSIPVTEGEYDVMIFNGLMYEPDDTHLDGIFFRGTDKLNTFEAVAAEAVPSIRLSRAEGEYIASNNMEIFTSMTARASVDAGGGYFLKYRNGEDQGDIPQGGVEAELKMTPVAMSYRAKVTVRLTNISSAYGADGSLHGFAGSAFAAERKPSHFLVTHQFNLNSKTVTDTDADVGTITSPEFVTFGPPVDMPDNRYSVHVRIALVDGEIFERTVDVTDQVLPTVEKIRSNTEGTGPPEFELFFSILVDLALPEAEPVEGVIGIDEWDDDEVIGVPVSP